MDLTRRSKNVGFWIKVILALSLLASVAYSWRISQKCPHGHYYNDGCTACWCDIRTGHTKCERLLHCIRSTNVLSCPQGRHFKDNCGNDCTCYESTGAQFCNEKRKCPLPLPSTSNSVFEKRMLPISPTPFIDILPVVSSTPASPIFFTPSATNTDMMMTASGSSPSITNFLQPFSTPNDNLFGKLSISSTALPHLRIPNRSAELIIEPAIIIRKKGSNKASVVRNPSSATSVTLSSRREPSILTPTSGTSVLFNPTDKPDGATNPTTPRQFAPIHLYEKQLQKIMDIKRAYAKLLRSKLSVNLLYPGKGSNPFSSVVLHDDPNSSTEHPRRFDSDFGNLTLSNTTPNSAFFGGYTSQQPKPPSIKTYQPFWRRPEVIGKEIRNTLKHFSPVPQLTQLVSYVTTSTEGYLSNFLGKKAEMPITNTHQPMSPPTVPFTYGDVASNNGWHTFPPPHHEIASFDTHSPPIHQIYQNHDYSSVLTTTPPPRPPSPPPPYSTIYKDFSSYSSSYYPKSNHLERRKEFVVPPPHNHHRFPYMTELMQEIARVDNYHPHPRPTPRTSPALTAVPTFQTPGPPYAEVDVVQPLSFLPPPKPEPATPTHRSMLVTRPPHHRDRHRPTVRVNMDKPIYIPPPPMPPPLYHPNNNRRSYVRPPPFKIHRQYIIPRPKQYRLVLKGGMREAAVKVDDVVPRFVSKIAHEFFKKPEIYVPKIRPGKPLTLEKVVLNHKEMVPKQVVFEPGAPATNLRFTPEAQWEMKSEMAKHGVMLDEPLTSVKDYAANDSNVMEMDSPIQAIQTFETHTGMNVANYPAESHHLPNTGILHTLPSPPQVPQQFHPPQLHPPQYPILLPSPTPQQVAPTLDHQHQQELQHQLMLAQQATQGLVSAAASGIGPTPGFEYDQADVDDFKHDNEEEDVLPKELEIPGVRQVVVDKFVVHDPLDPSGGPVVFSTTTVNPPNDMSFHNRGPVVQHHNDYGSTAPSVLIRHHGAPSTTPIPPYPTQPPQTQLSGLNNYYVAVISTTPAPPVTTTTSYSPQLQLAEPTVSTNVVSQIQDFLTDQMDFGAQPQSDLFEMLFRSRTGVQPAPSYSAEHTEDQVANETRFRGELETDRVASIFSEDYRNKHGKKAPEVIVIKVPQGHSDGPFPKIVEKRGGAEIEIQGASIKTSNSSGTSSRSANSKFDTGGVFSTENSLATSTSRSVDSTEASSEKVSDEETTERQKKRKLNKKKKKKKRKKERNRNREDNQDDIEDNLNSKDKSSQTPDANSPDEVAKNTEAEEKFQAEIDWKSQLMANICELNPSSPLCLTYRSICLLMTSDCD